MPEKCTDNPRDCPLLPRVEALEREIKYNKEAHGEFYDRLEETHTAVAVIEERVEQIKEDTKEIKESVRELKDKPGKRWDGFVNDIVKNLASGIIGFILAYIGLK